MPHFVAYHIKYSVSVVSYCDDLMFTSTVNTVFFFYYCNNFFLIYGEFGDLISEKSYGHVCELKVVSK
jgi:hypothetical protein